VSVFSFLAGVVGEAPRDDRSKEIKSDGFDGAFSG
jgi:hypothetical protein